MRQLVARLLLLKKAIDNLPLVTVRVRMHLIRQVLKGSEFCVKILGKVSTKIVTFQNSVLCSYYT
jgi:hypothetical protein